PHRGPALTYTAPGRWVLAPGHAEVAMATRHWQEGPTKPSRDWAVVGQFALAAAAMLCAAFYAVACAVDLFATNGIRSLAHAVASGQFASSAAISAKIAFYDHARDAVAAAFWLMYVLFFSLLLVIGRRHRAAGLRPQFSRVPAYNAWRIGVVVSLVVLVVAATTASKSGTPPALAHNATGEMAILGVRIAVGCLYVWCAWSIFAARKSLPSVAVEPPLPYHEYVAQREQARRA